MLLISVDVAKGHGPGGMGVDHGPAGLDSASYSSSTGEVLADISGLRLERLRAMLKTET